MEVAGKDGCCCFPRRPPALPQQPKRQQQQQQQRPLLPEPPGSRRAASRQRVTLNVGGKIFDTLRGTLTRYKGSELAALLDEEPEEDGTYFLDRNGENYNYILDFLRDGPQRWNPPVDMSVVREVYHEAVTLGLPELAGLLDHLVKRPFMHGSADSSAASAHMATVPVAPSFLAGSADSSAASAHSPTVPVAPSVPKVQPELPPERPAERPVELLDKTNGTRMPAFGGALSVGCAVSAAAIPRALAPWELPGGFGAPFPDNEAERLNELQSLSVLYTNNEEEHYDNITSVVAAMLDVPIVLVSLVADVEQWFKSKHGLTADTTPRDTSFCAFTFSPECPTAASLHVVEDAHLDPTVMNNPLVTGEPFIRFYCGCPLVTSRGLRLGALCAIDRQPRVLRRSEAQMMVNFGQFTVQELESTRLSKIVEAEDEELMSASSPDISDTARLMRGFAGGRMRKERMNEALSEMVLMVWVSADTTRWPILYGNRAWTTGTGVHVRPPEKFPGKATIVESLPGMEARPGQMHLWDYLMLASVSAEEVQSLLSCIKEAVNGTCLRSFAVGAQLNTPRSRSSMTFGGAAGTRVTCRFAPAEQPLDAAAAVIRPASSTTAAEEGLRPAGFPPGRLYFVVMKEVIAAADPSQDEFPVVRREHRSPSATSTSQSAQSRKSEPSRRADAMTTASATSCSGSENALRRESRNRTKNVTALRPPRSPFEDVKLLSKIGAGSFGEVYLSLWGGAPVVVKIIKGVSLDDQRVEESFEASLSASIAHPNVVQTYKHSTRMKQVNELGVQNRYLETWIVQEWCDRGALRPFCNKPRIDGCALHEAIEMTMEIALALAYLHDRGIIHGDLTPNNVLLKSNTSAKGVLCKVGDFGLARVLEGEDQGIVTESMGTVTHMPPELFSVDTHERVLSSKVDVYALGIIMHEVIVGQMPFVGHSAPQVVVKIATGARLELPTRCREDVAELFRACTHKKVQERANLDEVVRLLGAIHRDPSLGGGLCHLQESARKLIQKAAWRSVGIPTDCYPSSISMTLRVSC
mmetsp:Transcript_74994/g.193537  ORF Transcript_74994/g.193537 Transcript_74994/m.193537 type:complete len:1037 (-) Transcript_74994:97-3207(-)